MNSRAGVIAIIARKLLDRRRADYKNRFPNRIPTEDRLLPAEPGEKLQSEDSHLRGISDGNSTGLIALQKTKLIGANSSRSRYSSHTVNCHNYHKLWWEKADSRLWAIEWREEGLHFGGKRGKLEEREKQFLWNGPVGLPVESLDLTKTHVVISSLLTAARVCFVSEWSCGVAPIWETM